RAHRVERRRPVAAGRRRRRRRGRAGLAGARGRGGRAPGARRAGQGPRPRARRLPLRPSRAGDPPLLGARRGGGRLLARRRRRLRRAEAAPTGLTDQRDAAKRTCGRPYASMLSMRVIPVRSVTWIEASFSASPTEAILGATR